MFLGADARHCSSLRQMLVVVAITAGRGTLATTVKRLLVIAPLLLLFAMCIARAAQARAADDVKASGADKIVCAGIDDLAFTEGDSVSLDPPAVSKRALPLLDEGNAGRRVSSELFRPPTSA